MRLYHQKNASINNSIHLNMNKYKYLFYLLLKYLNLTTAGSSHINDKERENERQVTGAKKKGIKAQRARPPTYIMEIDALIGDEE